MKVNNRTTHFSTDWKSDSNIVPKIASNKEGHTLAEMKEERALAKRNVIKSGSCWTQCQNKRVGSLDDIRTRARKDKKLKFTSLFHHITDDLLYKSFYELKRKAAPGIDGASWYEYQKDLRNNIAKVYSKLQNGSYKAKPVLRCIITKDDGSERALGIASVEDKVIQQALCTVLNCIYEEDFCGFSYGFRPKRSQHHALDAVSISICKRKISWILDADIQGFFDNIGHDQLMHLLKVRIGDPRVLRLVSQWLKSGFQEKKGAKIYKSSKGCAQGAVISPLLANIFLHYVLDEWVLFRRQNYQSGDMTIIRYADDFIMGFQRKGQAEAFLVQLKTRFASFGLKLHEKKTRLINFGRFALQNARDNGNKRPESFDFLGFTHSCAKTRKGSFKIRRKTSCKKHRKACTKVRTDLRKRMHRPIAETGKWLNSVIRGHQNYYGVPGNSIPLNSFYKECVRSWLFTLRRRSQKGRGLTWKKFNRILERFIQRPKVVHPYPTERLCVTT